ncbi:MAG: hypothetical protein B6245_01170 [Desulfobacteraceae bacterium 4572_88]|nr:MAG: hypothetical protein B6245_01170 [Desulfobacteraceae bacterium 4572_88]
MEFVLIPNFLSRTWADYSFGHLLWRYALDFFRYFCNKYDYQIWILTSTNCMKISAFIKILSILHRN